MRFDGVCFAAGHQLPKAVLLPEMNAIELIWEMSIDIRIPSTFEPDYKQ